ncbi:LDCC motif putative metal-binding protein [Acidaminobacter hydrogenoformans]|nr:LDCC motif putative metal-binding protein [Acidaminobacter hydrogenoformans]
MLKKILKIWEKFLRNLAAQNKSTYGEGGLNCCELKEATEK